MRCLKVEAQKDNLEIAWPDELIIRLNGERIFEIPALLTNSSLKKRKDNAIQIQHHNLFFRNDSGEAVYI